MKMLSYIYSVSNCRRKETELQLCFTHDDLTELHSYCDRKDRYRKRGFIQGSLSIGRNLYADFPEIALQKQNIRNETLWLFDSRALKEESEYTFYRNGLIIHPIDLQLSYFNACLNHKDELVIECDRFKFEGFFQFLKAFSVGYWGDIFYFSPNFALSTCIHDDCPEDLEKLNPDL